MKSPWNDGHKAAQALKPNDVVVLAAQMLLNVIQTHADHLEVEQRMEVTVKVATSLVGVVLSLVPRADRKKILVALGNKALRIAREHDDG